MRIPSYRKHSSGQARVTIGKRDYLLGPYGSKDSKREYNRLIAEFLSADRSPAFGLKPAELTLIDLIHAYKKHCIRYYGIGPASEWHRIKIGLRAVRVLYLESPGISLSFGGGVKRMFNDSYHDARARFGIVKSLPMTANAP